MQNATFKRTYIFLKYGIDSFYSYITNKSIFKFKSINEILKRLIVYVYIYMYAYVCMYVYVCI